MTKTTEALAERVRELLAKGNVSFREVEHEPVYDYQKAAEIRVAFNLTGVESKSLFLKTRDGRWWMFISLQGKRLDSKRMKRLLGSSVSIASDQELLDRTGCEPGCAVPFGHGAEIGLVVDDEIFQHERFIFSPGPPRRTIEIATADVARLLRLSTGTLVHYPGVEGLG